VPSSGILFPAGLVFSGRGAFLCRAFPAAGFLVEAERAPVVAAPLAEVTVLAGMLLRSPVFIGDIEKPLDALHPNESHGKPLVHPGEKIKQVVRGQALGNEKLPFNFRGAV
jgi:hypothetical protein